MCIFDKIYQLTNMNTNTATTVSPVNTGYSSIKARLQNKIGYLKHKVISYIPFIRRRQIIPVDHIAAIPSVAQKTPLNSKILGFKNKISGNGTPIVFRNLFFKYPT